MCGCDSSRVTATFDSTRRSAREHDRVRSSYAGACDGQHGCRTCIYFTFPRSASHGQAPTPSEPARGTRRGLACPGHPPVGRWVAGNAGCHGQILTTSGSARAVFPTQGKSAAASARHVSEHGHTSASPEPAHGTRLSYAYQGHPPPETGKQQPLAVTLCHEWPPCLEPGKLQQTASLRGPEVIATYPQPQTGEISGLGAILLVLPNVLAQIKVMDSLVL